MSFAYVVRIIIDDPSAFAAFVAWLRERHVADVCAAGRCAGEIVVVDVPKDAPRVVEARYRFASREAFAAYERDHAPRLRSDGIAELARLGLEPGRSASLTRTTGPIVEIAAAPPPA